MNVNAAISACERSGHWSQARCFIGATSNLRLGRFLEAPLQARQAAEAVLVVLPLSFLRISKGEEGTSDEI